MNAQNVCLQTEFLRRMEAQFGRKVAKQGKAYAKLNVEVSNPTADIQDDKAAKEDLRLLYKC